MKNTVIKVLNKEHGKKVIDWFKSQGVDTAGYSGNVTEEDGGTAIYYGVIRDNFSNYFLEEVNRKKGIIMTLPETEKTQLDVCNDIYKPGMEVETCCGAIGVIDNTPFRFGLLDKRVYANDGDICLYDTSDGSYAKIVLKLPEECDMTTNEGRLAYAKKHYPIGTVVKSIHHDKVYKLTGEPRKYLKTTIRAESHGVLPDIYHAGVWAEIIDEVKEEEVDLSIPAGRLAYAAKHYPVGTRYESPEYPGKIYTVGKAVEGHQYWLGTGTYKNCVAANLGEDRHRGQFVCFLGKWGKIIKEEEMEKQQLSRKGLKEIHAVACTDWKKKLEVFGIRNPLEDYVELTQEEVNTMFTACSSNQLPIVSKYLKQDDGSVDISKITYNENGALLNDKHLIRHNAFTSIRNGFWLNPDYNWEVKMINDTPFLVPTKKK